LKICVDKGLCIGCGLCVNLYPNLFSIDEKNGKAETVYKNIPKNLEHDGSQCSDICPVDAIIIVNER